MTVDVAELLDERFHHEIIGRGYSGKCLKQRFAWGKRTFDACKTRNTDFCNSHDGSCYGTPAD